MFEDKLKNSGAKLALLKTALQRYQGMHIEGLANFDHMDVENLKEQHAKKKK